MAHFPLRNGKLLQFLVEIGVVGFPAFSLGIPFRFLVSPSVLREGGEGLAFLSKIKSFVNF